MSRALGCAVLAWASAAVAAPTRLAILPPRDPALGAAADARVEAALVDAAQALPGFVVVNLGAGKLVGGRKLEPRLEQQPAARALALGREVGAQRALAVEVTPLGDSLVVYLQAVEVPSGRSLGSTTLSLDAVARPGADRGPLRAALTRILEPDRYVGQLQIKVDVQGAEVQIDGRPAHAGLVELPVGTHALRVTHPAYHDFLRFLDVTFGAPISVEVNMAAYPLAEGEMTERRRRSLGALPKRYLPWYRTWWALSLAGVVLTGATATVIWLVRPGLDHADASTPFNPKPGP